MQWSDINTPSFKIELYIIMNGQLVSKETKLVQSQLILTICIYSKVIFIKSIILQIPIERIPKASEVEGFYRIREAEIHLRVPK